MVSLPESEYISAAGGVAEPASGGGVAEPASGGGVAEPASGKAHWEGVLAMSAAYRHAQPAAASAMTAHRHARPASAGLYKVWYAQPSTTSEHMGSSESMHAYYSVLNFLF